MNGSKRKKKIAPVVAATVCCVLLLVGIAVIALGVKNGTIPFKSVVLQLIVLLAMFVGILVALIERIKEIDGGEEDDARNY